MTRRLRLSRLLAAALGAALALSACSTGDAGTYLVTAEVSRAYTLFPGSPVRVLGVEVGYIDDIRISEASNSVFIDLRVEEDVQLPADVAAIIIPETMLGERYVQLEPPYDSGPTMPDGGEIPRERTVVPREFDEVLSSLNQFVGGLDPDEVARLVTNLAEVLDANGAQFGETLDSAHGAINVLQDNDEDLIRLAQRLSELNQTIASRDTEIAQLLRDYNALISSLVDDKEDLDATLDGLVRLTRELNRLLVVNRANLERDIETLTRVTRTTNRNLDQISLAVLSQAELFRHAERAFDFENNRISLLDHAGSLASILAGSLEDRLVGLCINLGVPEATCEQIPLGELVPEELCLPGLITCPSDGSVQSLGEIVDKVIEETPGFADAVAAERDRVLGLVDDATPVAGEDEEVQR